MDEAVGANLTVMRAWAVGVTAPYSVQTSPGVYVEAMLRGIDYALDQARQHNIRVCPPEIKFNNESLAQPGVIAQSRLIPE